MMKNVVLKKYLFSWIPSAACSELLSFRIINADTLCGRIANPPERGASYKIKYRFFIFYKNNCTT